jgi:Na+/H+ antiporter NhaD/arsenite permease-like protein
LLTLVGDPATFLVGSSIGMGFGAYLGRVSPAGLLSVPEIALAADFTDWPTATLPLFIAMMFGGTLGGNATLIGASSNIVSAGVCAAEGERVTIMRFMRIGLPITLVQLAASALYVVFILPALT